jgi:hypothetical protein
MRTTDKIEAFFLIILLAAACILFAALRSAQAQSGVGPSSYFGPLSGSGAYYYPPSGPWRPTPKATCESWRTSCEHMTHPPASTRKVRGR